MKISGNKSFVGSNLIGWVGLVGVLLFAFYVRASRADWGLPYLYYWDEPQIASAALRMLKTGNFNPYFYNYGTLPIYINYFIDIFHYLYLMGRPDAASAYLSDLADIKTQFDTRWQWTISHPSFYYWNRMLNVAFGVGSVWMTYLLASLVLRNKWLGLIAAFFLATVPVHIQFSALVTPDVPMVFFVLCAVYFSMRFLASGQTKELAISLIFVGFAIATKYHAALAVLLPLATVILRYFVNRRAFQINWFAMVLTIPLVTFFVCMPYALMDSASFLSALGWEIRHYKIMGHDPYTVIPGIRHIRFQVSAIIENVGLFAAIIAASGLLGSLKAPKLFLVIMLPSVYFFYMTTTKINFHRNFILLYPFIAILYAAAIGVLYELCQQFVMRLGLAEKGPTLKTLALTLVLPLTLVLYLTVLASTAMSDTREMANSRDSRSTFISKINLMTTDQIIYLPRELRMHEQDLRRLKHPFKLVALRDLFSCDKAATKPGLALIPETLEAGYEANEDEKKLALEYPMWLKQIDLSAALMTSGRQLLSLDKFSIDPKLFLFETQTLSISTPPCTPTPAQ